VVWEGWRREVSPYPDHWHFGAGDARVESEISSMTDISVARPTPVSVILLRLTDYWSRPEHRQRHHSFGSYKPMSRSLSFQSRAAVLSS
jgi:hypothetical protein